MNLSPARIHSGLLAWYQQNARSLPWRETSDPYPKWLSEIMLQQTRVETVLPYFHKFLARYPNVEALANAEIDELRSLWAGLGYYTRVMNLKRAAQAIMLSHGGEFPRASAELRTLPGIGPYTSAAIASMAFGEKIAAVDGNLERVLSRLLALPRIAKGAPEISALANQLVALGSPGEVNQAFMDLASAICFAKNPACAQCPLQGDCAAFQAGRPDAFPLRAPKKEKVELEAHAFLFFSGSRENAPNEIFLARRPEGAWLAGQWDIPWWIAGQDLGPNPGEASTLGKVEVKRVITHHKINFKVKFGFLKNALDAAALKNSMQRFSSDCRWARFEEIESLPRPTRKAIDQALLHLGGMR